MKNGSKTVSVGTKLSEEQAALFRGLASGRGMDESSYIRHLILREIVGNGEASSGSAEDSESIRIIRKKLGDLLRVTRFIKEWEIDNGHVPMTHEEYREICTEACKRD
jgi:hypothetical protein